MTFLAARQNKYLSPRPFAPSSGGTDPTTWAPAVGSAALVGNNVMNDIAYGTHASNGSVMLDNGTTSAYFQRWCSGAFASALGTMGTSLFFCGGDSDYWGNEVYAFDWSTLLWSRLTERSSPITGGNDGADLVNCDWGWGEHISTGGARAPMVPHSYDQLVYLPPAFTGNTKGFFVVPSRTLCYSHRAFHHVHYLNLDNNLWYRGSPSPNDDPFPGVGPNPLAGGEAPSWCVNPTTGVIYGSTGGQGNSDENHIAVRNYNTGTGLFGLGGSLWTASHWTLSHYPCGVFDPVRNLLISIGGKVTTGTFTILAIDPDTIVGGVTPWSQLPLAGDTISDPASGNEGYGIAYVPEVDCFYIKGTHPSLSQTLWKLTPPAAVSSAHDPEALALDWTVEAITMGGATAPASTVQGIWKRFMWIPAAECLVWCDSPAAQWVAYRVGV